MIGLPANLFYSTAIPTCILVFRAPGTQQRHLARRQAGPADKLPWIARQRPAHVVQQTDHLLHLEVVLRLRAG